MTSLKQGQHTFSCQRGEADGVFLPAQFLEHVSQKAQVVLQGGLLAELTLEDPAAFNFKSTLAAQKMLTMQRPFRPQEAICLESIPALSYPISEGFTMLLAFLGRAMHCEKKCAYAQSCRAISLKAARSSACAKPVSLTKPTLGSLLSVLNRLVREAATLSIACKSSLSI